MKKITLPIAMTFNITEIACCYVQNESRLGYEPVESAEEMLDALKEDGEPVHYEFNMMIDDELLSPENQVEIARQVFQEYCRIKNNNPDGKQK